MHGDIFDASQSKISFILLVNQVSGHFQQIMMFEEKKKKKRKKTLGVIFLSPPTLLSPTVHTSPRYTDC